MPADLLCFHLLPGLPAGLLDHRHGLAFHRRPRRVQTAGLPVHMLLQTMSKMSSITVSVNINICIYLRLVVLPPPVPEENL